MIIILKSGKCYSQFLIVLFQSSHAHLFLQGDDKLYINQGDSLQKVYHNCKSFPLDPNLMDTGLYSSAGKQGNLFSQSYNICMNSYMSGEFISVPNEDLLSTELDDYEVGTSLQVTSILSESKHWIIVQSPVAYMATNWPIKVSITICIKWSPAHPTVLTYKKKMHSL